MVLAQTCKHAKNYEALQPSFKNDLQLAYGIGSSILHIYVEKPILGLG